MTAPTSSAARARIGWIAAGLILFNAGVALLALAPGVPPAAGWGMIGTGAVAVFVALVWRRR